MEKELNMKDIEDLLKEIKPSIKKYNDNKNKRMETGFNLFYLISDYYYRETFHGDIIAALLDPNEKHGYNNLYTNLFIDMINKSFVKDSVKSKDSVNNVNKMFYTTPKVIKEFPTDDGNLRGRIDIFIEGNVKDKEGKAHCIVIENKLYNAGDTEQQLPKYARYLKKRDLEIDAFVYMPLDPNKMPNQSDWSTKEKEEINKKLVIIPAYKPRKVNLINNWLKPALKKSKGDASFIIKQYIRVLNNLTVNIMIMDNKKLIKVLSKDDTNIDATLGILENAEAFYNQMVKDFILKLGKEVKEKEKGYGFSNDGTERIEIYNDKIIKKAKWKYVIEWYKCNGRYYRKIEMVNGNGIKPNDKHFFRGDTAGWCTEKYPLGENYFDEDLSYWDKPSTIREMRNGNFAEKIIEEAKSAFNRMDELSKQ